MIVKLLKTDDDYRQALKRIDELWEARLNTPEGDELELLITLVQAYEDKHHPVYPPDPVEAIKIAMEEQGLKNIDVAPYFGSTSRVSEVLNRKRGLTLDMIRKLHKHLKIPIEVLIGLEAENA